MILFISTLFRLLHIHELVIFTDEAQKAVY